MDYKTMLDTDPPMMIFKPQSEADKKELEKLNWIITGKHDYQGEALMLDISPLTRVHKI